MKRKKLFWGFFFLTLGLLALLNRYFAIDIDFDLLSESWPLILIVLGFAVIFTGKVVRTIIGILLGILLGAVVFGIFRDSFIFPSVKSSDISFYDDSSPVYEKYNPAYEYATIKLKAGASKIIIDGTTDNLWECSFSRGGDWLDTYTDAEGNNVTSEIELNNKFWNFWGTENLLKLKLNESPVWSLALKIGAATAELHLEEYKLERLDLSAGATNSKIYIGNRFPLTKVKVEIGAANLTLFIPEDTGCKIRVKSLLVNKKFSNFIYNGDGEFVSPNFRQAVNKVLISFEGGLANFKVKYY